MTKDSRATTPMLEQYWRLKDQHPDALLFFRLGDFYELFDKDAEIAAPLLDLQLTSRDGRVSMCGVPWHAGNQHARRLLEQGFTVAIAEQVEDPAQARGLVERQVIRVLTPGTLIPDDDEGLPRLGLLYRHRQGYVAIMVELSTGTLQIAETSAAPEDRQYLSHVWATWAPNEYLSNSQEKWAQNSFLVDQGQYFQRADAIVSERLITDTFGLNGLRQWGLDGRPWVRDALAALARYLQRIRPGELPHLQDIRVLEPGSRMRLSSRALEQLGVSGTVHSLAERIDFCRTKMGSRRLRDWLEHPLAVDAMIQPRMAAVAHLVEDALLRDTVRTALERVGDLSRRVARLTMGQGRPRDVFGVYQALMEMPQLLAVHNLGIWSLPKPVLQASAPELARALDVLVSPPPARWDDTPLIRDQIDARIDENRGLLTNHRQALLTLEQSERERSGIKSLRSGYHRTFGYYLEVVKSQAKNVPDDWHRRQTTAHTERYISDPLKELERAIIDAQAQSQSAEKEWAERLQNRIREESPWLIAWAAWLSEVDALSAMAEASVRYRYHPPEFVSDQSGVLIQNLRHPVLEALVDEYVTSSLELSFDQRTLIITGPNMGGKSTFMRAVAQNIILAQCGCWVAAESYRAPLFDAVLTRIGADDDLVRGQSTFMVEMEEVAAILRQVSANSIVLLDELGRGTSTYDGMAIAQSVIERLAAPDGPLTFCATHYHELTEIAESNGHVLNLTVEVLGGPEGPLFSHQVVPGRASQSYGIEVARQAGLPAPLVRRAQSHLKHWEENAGKNTATPPALQLTFDNPDPLAGPLLGSLRDLNPDDLSPREAWLWISEWKSRMERGVP